MRETFILQGLDCPDCAAKIQEAVSRLDGVGSASLDFMTGKLVVSGADGRQDEISRQVVAAVGRLEPDVTVSTQRPVAAKDGEDGERHVMLVRIGVGALLYAISLLYKPAAVWFTPVISILALAVLGYDVFYGAVRRLCKGAVLDEHFLMAVATIGAFAIGQYDEGVAVMLFYQVGELFQDYAVDRSRRSIAGLMDIRPDYANLLREGVSEKVDPALVGVGDSILVKPGEKVPLDGIVLKGSSSLDTAALTGESLPRSVTIGDQVLSGCVNQAGMLTVKVTKPFGESTASKILDLVENASAKKARSENFITRFAKIYTPAVVGAAVLLAVVPPLVVKGAVFTDWLYRALLFLVVSCPCALVISVPLSFFGGIGGASRKGVLVKGSNYLEALAHAEIVVFDKTGTLTQGRFQVAALHPQGIDADRLLRLAASVESYSSHPIAASLRQAYGHDIPASAVTDVKEIAGCGVTATVEGHQVAAGSPKLMEQMGLAAMTPTEAGTLVHVACDGVYVGCIVIADAVKEDAADAIKGLKQAGVAKTVMLTGDSPAIARQVAARLGVDEVHAGLLPDGKVAQLEGLLAQRSARGRLVFVGDGINDAPVLARADVGIAMGALGSDAAIEAADVVIMDDRPSKLVSAVRIARKTMRIVTENIAFALAVKAAILVLGALGRATMWEAVFADVGVAFLAILNAIRMLDVRRM